MNLVKTLTTLQLTRVMAGLTQTESEETNMFLLTYNTLWIADAGWGDQPIDPIWPHYGPYMDPLWTLFGPSMDLYVPSIVSLCPPLDPSMAAL